MSEFVRSLFRRRRYVAAGAAQGAGELKRALRASDLVLVGLGNIVGGGIYILFGTAAQAAGPAVTLAFLCSGFAAACSALCYAEFAARIPEAGSAYVFTYHEAGEFLAWQVGWAMVLECIVGAAAASVGWSNYTRSFLRGLGLPVPAFLQEMPLAGFLKIDLMSLGFLSIVTLGVAVGIRESKWMNHLATAAKLGGLGLVITFAFVRADPGNWADFSPHGVTGVVQAAATVMFAFTGFEVVAQCAEETVEPRWMLPVGIVGSVAIATVAYVLVAAAVTLMVPWQQIDLSAPLATAFATRVPWLAPVISAAAVLGLFAIGVGGMIASSRLLMTLSRDGLLPRVIGSVNQTTKTPFLATLTCGSLSALLTLFFSYKFLSEVVSVGTMFAFTMVCTCLVITRSHDEARPALLPGVLLAFAVSCFAGSMAWRRSMWLATIGASVFACGLALYVCVVARHPAWAGETFTVPMGQVVALLGIGLNCLMSSTLDAALEWNVTFFAIGWVIYFGYGRLHSRLVLPEGASLTSAPVP